MILGKNLSIFNSSGLRVFNPSDWSVYSYWNTEDQLISGTTTTIYDQVGSEDVANPDSGSQPTYSEPFQVFSDGDKLVANVTDYRASDTTGIITFKFKPTVDEGTNNHIFGFYGAGGAGNALIVLYRDMRLRVTCIASSVGVTTEYQTDLTVNQEYVVSVLSNGSEIKMIVDGSFVTLTDIAGTNTGQWLSHPATNQTIEFARNDSAIQYAMYSAYTDDATALNLNNELLGLESYNDVY